MRIHSEVHGTGPSIICTHGLGDDSTRWDALCGRLADRFTVTTWDLPAHGRSAVAATLDGYSHEAVLADLQELIDGAGAPVTLIGHSLGGFLSLALSLRRPEKVAALVMIAAGPGYRDPAGRAKWNAGIDRVAQRLPIPPEAARLAHQHDSTVIDTCHQLRPPLLQILGGEDVRYAAGARYLQNRVPGSQLLEVAGAGHHPQESHAAEVAAAIREFTRAASLGDGS